MSETSRSFGERKGAYVRLPEDQYELYDARAAQEGLDLGPWIAKKLALHEGEPIPDFVGRIKRRKRSKRDAMASHDQNDREGNPAA